jgi:hypothetical protein
MVLHRRGRCIRSDSPKAPHYAWERSAGQYALTYWRDEVFTEESMRAGLRIAELAAQYGEELLFSDAPETHMLWRLLDSLATELGLAPLTAVLASFKPPLRASGVLR